jgi:hypothetical protein
MEEERTMNRTNVVLQIRVRRGTEVSDEEETANVILRKLTGFHDRIGLAGVADAVTLQGQWKLGCEDRFRQVHMMNQDEVSCVAGTGHSVYRR